MPSKERREGFGHRRGEEEEEEEGNRRFLPPFRRATDECSWQSFFVPSGTAAECSVTLAAASGRHR
jgi:hypothetical protein